MKKANLRGTANNNNATGLSGLATKTFDHKKSLIFAPPTGCQAQEHCRLASLGQRSQDTVSETDTNPDRCLSQNDP